MPYCPVCRDEFVPGIASCPDHGVALVESLPPDAPIGTEVVGTRSQLGTFNRFIAPVLVEILAARGIDAVIADPLRDVNRGDHPDIAIVYVTTSHLEEARRIVADALPAQLEEIERATAADPAFVENDAIEAVETSPWGYPIERADGEIEEVDATPIGFMEPDVAKVFVALCDEVDVFVDPEYPLDQPPPVFARPDGRVRMHVEVGYEDLALEVVRNELGDELRRRGTSFTEPLLETSE